MDKKTFLQGIKHLNAYFNTFNFNINDDLKLKVWYESLSAFDDTTYTNLIKNYCTNNIYPPQSPSHLMDYAKKVVIDSNLSGELAWEKALNGIRQAGYNFTEFHATIENKVISDSVKEIESEFYGLMIDQIPFVRKHFIEVYNRLLERTAKELVYQSQVLLT